MIFPFNRILISFIHSRTHCPLQGSELSHLKKDIPIVRIPNQIRLQSCLKTSMNVMACAVNMWQDSDSDSDSDWTGLDWSQAQPQATCQSPFFCLYLSPSRERFSGIPVQPLFTSLWPLVTLSVVPKHQENPYIQTTRPVAFIIIIFFLFLRNKLDHTT